VVESDDALREHIVAVLRDAGYEVLDRLREGMKTVLVFDPDAVVLGADPPQLDCCDLLSEIKGSERTPEHTRCDAISGGSVERTRGWNLGADDVLSLPSTRMNCCRGCVRNCGTNTSRTSFRAAERESKRYPAGCGSGE